MAWRTWSCHEGNGKEKQRVAPILLSSVSYVADEDKDIVSSSIA